MEKYFLILRGNNKDLAIKEFEILWSLYFNEKIELKNIQNVLYCFSSKNSISKGHKLFSRITYTNYLGIQIGVGKDLSELSNNLNLNFKELDKKSFVLRFKKSKSGIKIEYTEKDFAKLIWDKLKNPKVDLEKSEFEFNGIFYQKQKELIITEKLFENEKDYSKRMPKLRPVKMPYTLKSDMARASVNLLGLGMRDKKLGKRENGGVKTPLLTLNSQVTILDPFCGIGGILLEAYDMDFKIIGNDISWNDLKYMKENFEYYFKDANYIRTLADSSTQFLKENSVDGIVTDIPYGKSSRKLGVNLYENFLKSAKIYLKPNKRLVIIYANFVEFKQLALKYFDEIYEIEEYINKSMTRYILVLENRKKL